MIKRLTERLAELDASMPGLRQTITEAEARWQEAVTGDDSKAEGTAAKALSAARTALADAETKRPLLADALRDAQLAALPAEAEAQCAAFALTDARAAELALKVLEHHQAGEALAAEVRRLHEERGEAGRAFGQKCRDLGVERQSLPVPPAWPVDMPVFAIMYRDYKFNTPARCRPTRETILRRGYTAPVTLTGVPNDAA